MATIKITDLPAGGSTLSSNDVFPVVDSGTNTTKKVTLQNIENYISNNIGGGGGAGVDSAGTIALIQDTVDSDYINARVETVNQGLDFGTFTSPSGITLDMGSF